MCEKPPRGWDGTSCCQHPPVFEGVVYNGFEDQAVPDLRWSPKVEHLNGLQRGVGMAQPAVGTSVTPLPIEPWQPCAFSLSQLKLRRPRKSDPWLLTAKTSHEKEQCVECEPSPGVVQQLAPV